MTTDTTEKGLESLILRPMTDPGGLNVPILDFASGFVLFPNLGRIIPKMGEHRQ